MKRKLSPLCEQHDFFDDEFFVFQWGQNGIRLHECNVVPDGRGGTKYLLETFENMREAVQCLKYQYWLPIYSVGSTLISDDFWCGDLRYLPNERQRRRINRYADDGPII